MPINKVIYGKQILMDLTGDTITEDALLEGITAHDKSGNIVTGKLKLSNNSLAHTFDGFQPVSVVKHPNAIEETDNKNNKKIYLFDGTYVYEEPSGYYIQKETAPNIDIYTDSNGVILNRKTVYLDVSNTTINETTTSVDDILNSLMDRSITSLTSGVVRIGESAFRACDSLSTVELLKANYIGPYSFRYDHSLESVILHSSAYIRKGSFEGCTMLTNLYLMDSSKMYTLENTTAFNKTPIATGTGYIHVPSTLINQYKSDSIWKTYANRIVAI